MWSLTIVYDDAGDAEGLLDLVEGLDYILSLCEVAWDIQLVVGAIGLFDRAGSDADSEAF